MQQLMVGVRCICDDDMRPGDPDGLRRSSSGHLDDSARGALLFSHETQSLTNFFFSFLLIIAEFTCYVVYFDCIRSLECASAAPTAALPDPTYTQTQTQTALTIRPPCLTVRNSRISRK